MSDLVNGYIICHNDLFLSRKHIWNRKDEVRHAYVFPWWQAEDVLGMAEGWEQRPTHIYKAKFDELTGEVTVGELFKKVEETA